MNDVKIIEEITADVVDLGDMVSFVAEYEDDGETVIENVIMAVMEIEDNGDHLVFRGTSFFTEETVKYNLDPTAPVYVIQVD